MILNKCPIFSVYVKVMVKIYEYCFSMSMALPKFMCKKCMMILGVVCFFCVTNTPTLYTSWVCIDLKG